MIIVYEISFKEPIDSVAIIQHLMYVGDKYKIKFIQTYTDPEFMTILGPITFIQILSSSCPANIFRSVLNETLSDLLVLEEPHVRYVDLGNVEWGAI